MSYQTLWECRELDKLAAELDFTLSSTLEDKIAVRCRRYSPEEDPQGVAVKPYSKWELGTGYSFMEGTVTEVLYFLRGIQFMQNYVNLNLGLKKRIDAIHEKKFLKRQQAATMSGLINDIYGDED